jgi:protein TonB
MKALTINHVAILAAVALHALLLAVQVRPQTISTETITKIAIHLVAPREPAQPQVPPRSVPLHASTENKIQNHQLPGPPLPPAKVALPPAAPPLLPVETAAKMPALQPAPQAAEAIVPMAAPVAITARVVPAPVAAPAASRLPDYLAAVRTQVENHKDYPAFARQLKQQGTVTVRVTIGSDGRLREAAVSNSSGHASLDKAALAAVRNAGRFRAPDDFGLGDVTVDIPITYKLI